MKFHRIFCVSLFIVFFFVLSDEAFPQKQKPKPKRKTTAQPVRIQGIANVTVSGGETPLGMNPAQQRRWEAFIKVWETLNRNYFDQTFNNLDWYKVKADFKPRVVSAKTDAEFHQLMQEMIDLLDRSHFAIVPPEVYREIERTRSAAKAQEKLRRDNLIADGADPESLPDEGPLIDESKYKFGTGIELRLIKGQFVISRVDKDSAADYVGVKPGFVLDQINGVSLTDMVGRTMIYYSKVRNIERYLPHQIVEWFLNGEKDSYVTINCLDAEDKSVEFKIRRERLFGQRISIGENYPEQFLRFESRSLSGDVGYINFNLFALPIIEKFCGALTEFKDKKAIVIDLRGNIGGIVGTIYALSGMLTEGSLDMGTSIYMTGNERMIARSKAKNFKGRIVFLVDGQTISAAEIFSAGIRENDRALIVGEKTAGEALPSITLELPTGAVFLYPIANFRTVKGNFLEGNGVTPDFVVSLDRKALLNGTDPHVEKALALIAEDKAFPTGVRLPPPVLAGGRISPPTAGSVSPTPKPAISVYQGDSGQSLGSGSGPAPRPAQLKTIQGDEVRAPVAVKPVPEIFTKEVIAPKDAKSLQIIADFVGRIGGQARWKALKSYVASGSNSGEIKGANVEWDFRAYRKEPDKYAFILSSPVIGEVRQIYDAKKILLQTDFGTEESIDNTVGSNLFDLFAPIRVLMDDETIKSLNYQGIFVRDGRNCHVIEAKTKNGETIGLAFDVETKLLVSYAARAYTIGYSDYRKVSDLQIPFGMDLGRSGNLHLDSIVLDQPIDEAVFIRKENCFDKPN